jgi:hypothetical protein
MVLAGLLSSWGNVVVLLSLQVFWGGDGPNDKGLSRKHIIEGTKVTLHVAISVARLGTRTCAICHRCL